MYQLIIYIPQSHCELVKKALFDAGAGQYKHYDQCSWQVAGTGQFRPLTGSTPFVGKNNKLNSINEIRVEMICKKAFIKPAIKAMLTAHPYEEPAYLILKHYSVDLL
ncbi:MAG: NGG1p interacting factor NIF3 [Thiotrichaceae bacterium]|nr:NGG1p interacting factor NIF3 [Thiotrichaceae bacterium]